MLVPLVAASLLGAMVMFNVIVTPVVFSALNERDAGRFLRLAFPRLFLFCLVLTLVLTGLAIDQGLPGIALSGLVISLGFVFNIWFLTPRINQARDRMVVDGASAARFHRLHLLSVGIFVSQALGLIGILWFL